jgi:hypothetical protein
MDEMKDEMRIPEVDKILKEANDKKSLIHKPSKLKMEIWKKEY